MAFPLRAALTFAMLLALVAGWPSLAPAASSQDTSDRPDGPGWARAEAPVLSGHRQLTSRSMFTRAGEAYFSPAMDWVIFQATPVPERGEAPSPHYEMFVARTERGGDGAITGLGTPIRVSTGQSANTCGWFHPTTPNVVLFGSTVSPPAADKVPGYQRGTGRYAWSFPTEMEIVSGSLSAPLVMADEPDGFHARRPAITQPLFERPGYTAEASWSPDGRTILYAQVDPSKSERLGRADADLWAFDTQTGEHHPLVVADGYDGGPFFSPDGTRICYRSDRKGDNLLQLFVADLAFNDQGVPVGITRERQLTDNQHVNWAPFWHPDGDFLVYASSQVGHRNYEVFAIRAQGGAPVRVTEAPGADVLPVLSPDGEHLMWTAQRGPLAEGEQRPSSQLWVARVDADAIRDRLRKANENATTASDE